MAESISSTGTSPGFQIYLDTIVQAFNQGFSVYDEWKARQAHPKADLWVGVVQNSFGAKLSLIVDAKDAAIRAGIATADDVYFARQAVAKLWLGYQDVASQFAALGPQYAEVISGSYETLTPIVNGILRGMDDEIAERGGASIFAIEGVTPANKKLVVAGLVLVVFLVVWRAVK